MDKNILKGFTLFEIVIVVAILSLTLLFTTPIAIAQLQGSDSDSGSKQLIGLILDAQQSAYSRKNRGSVSGLDKCYGVSFSILSSRQYQTFYSDYSAGSCGTKSTTAVAQLGRSTATTTLSDVTFPPGSLKPLISGTISIQDSSSIYNVLITDEGAIYNKKIQ